MFSLRCHMGKATTLMVALYRGRLGKMRRYSSLLFTAVLGLLFIARDVHATEAYRFDAQSDLSKWQTKGTISLDESRPATGCNLEEYTVRGAATNLCVQHPPGATVASERNATIYAQGMVHQLASFVRLASGAETVSSCTLADALEARLLVDASLAK